MKKAYLVMDKEPPYWYSYPLKCFLNKEDALAFASEMNSTEESINRIKEWDIDCVFYVEEIELK